MASGKGSRNIESTRPLRGRRGVAIFSSILFLLSRKKENKREGEKEERRENESLNDSI